jgi:hypothetical protein
VLCDRFTGSTWAYQGYGRGLMKATIRDLEFLATGGLMADLTLWLDVSVAESIRRRGGQSSDRIEAGGWEFLSRVRRGFAAVAGQQSWTLIKAEHGEAAVTEACCRAMLRQFGGKGMTPDLVRTLLARRAYVPPITLLDCLDLSQWLGMRIRAGLIPEITSLELQARWACDQGTVLRRISALLEHQLLDCRLQSGPQLAPGAYWAVHRVGPVA